MRERLKVSRTVVQGKMQGEQESRRDAEGQLRSRRRLVRAVEQQSRRRLVRAVEQASESCRAAEQEKVCESEAEGEPQM